MTPPRTIWYDRRISNELKAELEPAGRLSRLVQFARGRHLADVQLRKSRDGSRSWVSVYAGLTKILDVENRRKEFRLRADSSYIDRNQTGAAGSTPLPWNEWRSAKALMTQWPAIQAYLAAQFKDVGNKFINEGAVQAMLCAHGGDTFRVIDREAVLNFASTNVREDVYRELRDPLVQALADSGGNAWWKPPSPGGEVDLLAVDSEGRVLVIEVKPANSLTGITWAPLQVAFYARLFRRWAEEARHDAVDILEAMLQQRVSLGLEERGGIPLKDPVEFVPVIAIEDPPRSHDALKRLGLVRDRLVSGDLADEALAVWLVRPSVRVQAWSPH